MSFFSAGLQRFDTKLPSPSGFVHQYIAEHRFGADDTLNSLRGVPTLVSLCRYSGFAFLFHAPHSVFTVSAPAFSHGSNILGVKLSVCLVKFAVNQRIAYVERNRPSHAESCGLHCGRRDGLATSVAKASTQTLPGLLACSRAYWEQNGTDLAEDLGVPSPDTQESCVDVKVFRNRLPELLRLCLRRFGSSAQQTTSQPSP